jgi:ABC-type phosphate transport system substrate-binding protein
MYPAVVLADIAIIASPKLEINKLSKSDAAKLFLGKVKTTEAGNTPQIFDLPDESAVKSQFYQLLTRKNPAQLHSYRARKLFTGQAYSLPIVLNSQQDVLMTVANSENAMAYLPIEAVDGSVKVLLVIKE